MVSLLWFTHCGFNSRHPPTDFNRLKSDLSYQNISNQFALAKSSSEMVLNCLYNLIIYPFLDNFIRHILQKKISKSIASAPSYESESEATSESGIFRMRKGIRTRYVTQSGRSPWLSCNIPKTTSDTYTYLVKKQLSQRDRNFDNY